MKYVRQLLIILFISFLGELLKYIIPLSIPASIYGMVLLFLALELKILKVSDIKETSNFLNGDRHGSFRKHHAVCDP